MLTPCFYLLGYNGTFKKRSGNKVDGCATFFKRNKFSVDGVHLIDYYRQNVQQMDRFNVAILLFLHIRSDCLKKKSTLCISNTHLLFNKRRGDIKITQLAHLLADIEQYSRAKKYDMNRLTTILCGDFNCQPFSPLYNFIITGEMKYEGLSKHLVSGQCKDSGNVINKFGKILFPSDVGLSNNCQWTGTKSTSNCQPSGSKSETFSNSKRKELNNNVGTNSLRKKAKVDTCEKTDSKLLPDKNAKEKELQKTIFTFNVETGCYEVLHKGLQTVKKSESKDKLHTCHFTTSKLLTDNDRMEKPGHLRHRYSFASCYAHYGLDGAPEVTTCHDRDAATVDYIFYPKSSTLCLEKDHLALCGVLSLCNECKLNKMHKLPNKYFSSDHLLLQASFMLKQL